MNKDDFRYMRQKKQILELKSQDLPLLKAIEKQGNKCDKVLLMLHGLYSSPAVFRYLIPHLKAYDAIVCPILPGHADSIDAFAQSTACEWFDKTHEICQELNLTYKKVDVLGLSLGGLLALKLSEEFKLNHLYLLAPAIKLQYNVKRMIFLAQILQFFGFQDLRTMAGNILTKERADIAYRKLPLSIVLEICTFVQDYEWQSPDCPVDLFLGEHDEVVSSKEVEAIVANSDNVTLHVLKNSAHILPLDNDLDQIIKCVNSSKP